MMKEYIRARFNVNEEMTENKEIFSDCDGLFDGEISTIALKSIHGDFGPEELADAVDIAEKLYFSLNKPVILCLTMDSNNKVLVKEMSIKSEADFSIKLACDNPYEIALKNIEKSIEMGTYDELDIRLLNELPIYAPEGERKRIRTECLRLLSKI